MKRIQMIKRSTSSVLAMIAVGMTPWMATVQAEVSEETQAQINQLVTQDSQNLGALEQQLFGLSAKEIGEAFSQMIAATPRSQIGMAVRRFANAAISASYNEANERNLSALAVAQQLGLNMYVGASQMENVNDRDMAALLTTISSSTTKGALEVAKTKDRTGIVRKLAYGAVRDVEDTQYAKALTKGITSGSFAMADNNEIDLFGDAIASGAYSGSSGNAAAVQGVMQGVQEGANESGQSQAGNTMLGQINSLSSAAASGATNAGPVSVGALIDPTPASPVN